MENRIGFGPRLGAYVIDIVFVWILSAIISAILPSFFVEMAQKQIDEILSSNQMVASLYTGEMLKILVSATRIALIVNVAQLLYFSTEIFLGASVGKMLLSLKIANVDGGNASAGSLVARYLLKHISKVCTVLALFCIPAMLNLMGNLFGFVIFIGCFFAAGDRHQALHDMMCRTVVVKKGENVEG
ncbi:MAG: RDD family protein [Salinivirgaceae bacterium]|nr:RDD family protein [Salinivirgaceae bacterium]